MNVLITGGTGLIGTRLSALLTAAGHDVALLSRTPAHGGPYRVFVWDPAAGPIDAAAVPSADVIVNLAGANVAEGRWTDARKQALRASRLDSLALLHRELATPGTACAPCSRPRPSASTATPGTRGSRKTRPPGSTTFSPS